MQGMRKRIFKKGTLLAAVLLGLRLLYPGQGAGGRGDVSAGEVAR